MFKKKKRLVEYPLKFNVSVKKKLIYLDGSWSKNRAKRRLRYLLRIRCIRQHTSAYVSIRQHTSKLSEPNDVCSTSCASGAYVSIRKHTGGEMTREREKER